MFGITPGIVQKLAAGSDNLPEFSVQVLSVKNVAGPSTQPGAKNRYRLLVSDSIHTHNKALLGSSLNHLVEGGSLNTNAVITVKRYIVSEVHNSPVAVFNDVVVAHSGDVVKTPIGNAVPVPKQGGDNGAQQPTAAVKPLNSVNTNGQALQGNAPRKVPDSMATDSVPMVNRTITSICALNPYQNRWTIKGRCTLKAPIKEWNNTKGSGRLFSFQLMDESGEIRITCFTEFVDKYNELLEVDKVYYLSKASLKLANRAFNTTNHEYEATVNSETEIQACVDVADVPKIQLKPTKISEIESCPSGANVDVIGIVTEVQDVITITAKSSGKEVKKRDITICDDSKHSIRLTLWAQDAEGFNYTDADHPVVLIRNAKVGDFGGRNLSVGHGSVFQVTPNIPQAYQLKGWYESSGKHETMESFKGSGSGGFAPNWHVLSDIKEQGLGMKDVADYVTVHGVIFQIEKERAIYKGCPKADCNKKLIDNGDGTFRCEKCNATTTDFKYRLMLSLCVVDCSDMLWVTAFQETAEQFLGMSAQQLGELRARDEEGFNRVCEAKLFSEHIFKLRCHAQVYNDERKIKTNVQTISPVDPDEYMKVLEREFGIN